LCSEINHQKFYSGEFDIEWGDTITETTHWFKKQEMVEYRQWLAENNFNWEDPRLSLGYIKLGQVDLQTSFQDTKFQGIYESMKNNLNISRIQISGDENIANDFPYTLESDNWKQIQMEGLESGNKSRSVR